MSVRVLVEQQAYQNAIQCFLWLDLLSSRFAPFYRLGSKNRARDVPLQRPSYWHSKTKRLKHCSAGYRKFARFTLARLLTRMSSTFSTEGRAPLSAQRVR